MNILMKDGHGLEKNDWANHYLQVFLIEIRVYAAITLIGIVVFVADGVEKNYRI